MSNTSYTNIPCQEFLPIYPLRYFFFKKEQNLQSPTPVVLGILFMLTATVLLASMHAIARHLSSDIHPFVIVFFRNLFGLLAVVPLFIRHGSSCLQTGHPKLHLIRVGVGLFAMLSWFYALAYVPITNATALSFSATIFATLSAWFFLGEKMRLRRWMAILAGLVGVMVVLQPGLDGFNIYSLLVIASTVSWGISMTIVKKLSATDSSVSIVGWMSISLTVLSIWPALFFWQWPTPEQFLLLACIGALASAGHLCIVNALRRAETAIVTSVDFCRLIWTAIIGSIFFDELLDQWTLIGAIIIFGSGWYIVVRESKLQKAQARESTTSGES